MATAPGFIANNANPSIGQGLAFVLPQSNTERYAMQLGQQHAADLRAAAAAQAKQQQLLQAQYQKDLTAQKLPEYWAQAGKVINEDWNKYQTDAAAYQATTGKNPFTNPEFMKRQNDILLKARQSKELESTIGKLLPMVAADHDNRFTEDSKKLVNEYVQGALANPTEYLGKPAPQLSGTPSGIQDLYKTIKPVSIKNDNGTLSTTVPDTSAMMAQAYENSNDPRWNNVKRTLGIDPEIGDIGSVYNPQGKRVWYTSPQATDHIATEILTNPTLPHNAEILAKVGIAPDSPYAKEKLQDIITKQNTGYGKLITDAGKYGSSLVSKSRDYKPPFTPYQLFEMQWKKDHPPGQKVPDEPTYFQDLSERARTGVEGSGEELSSIFQNNPAYLKGLDFDFLDSGKIKITVPDKFSTDSKKAKKYKDGDKEGQIIPNSDRDIEERSHTYTLDKNNVAEWTNTMAQIYKLGTGETVNPTKASTQSGKGKVKGGLNPVQAKPANTNKAKLTKGSLDNL